MVELVLRVVLALIFGAAAVGKAIRFAYARRTVADVCEQVLGTTLSSRTARGLTVLLITYEFVLGLLFLTGIAALLAAVSALILTFAFGLVSLMAVRTALRIECNCFGAGETMLGWQTLGRATLLGTCSVAYLAAGLIEPHRTYSLDAWASATGVALAAILLVRWMLALKALKDLVSQRRTAERQALEA